MSINLDEMLMTQQFKLPLVPYFLKKKTNKINLIDLYKMYEHMAARRRRMARTYQITLDLVAKNSQQEQIKQKKRTRERGGRRFASCSL